MLQEIINQEKHNLSQRISFSFLTFTKKIFDQPYSLNCEVWGPGFIYPYITGLDALEIYRHSIQENQPN